MRHREHCQCSVRVKHGAEAHNDTWVEASGRKVRIVSALGNGVKGVVSVFFASAGLLAFNPA
jgi:hypothetical protein